MEGHEVFGISFHPPGVSFIFRRARNQPKFSSKPFKLKWLHPNSSRSNASELRYMFLNAFQGLPVNSAIAQIINAGFYQTAR